LSSLALPADGEPELQQEEVIENHAAASGMQLGVALGEMPRLDRARERLETPPRQDRRRQRLFHRIGVILDELLHQAPHRPLRQAAGEAVDRHQPAHV
jgi:hypothetical protein